MHKSPVYLRGLFTRPCLWYFSDYQKTPEEGFGSEPVFEPMTQLNGLTERHFSVKELAQTWGFVPGGNPPYVPR